ncbi:hypothetical protein ISS05_01480 [Candidatus Woesearchaeota archaeon]|nr:hypothetical protein [Candidatus Woesearchaeota archaeon]
MKNQEIQKIRECLDSPIKLDTEYYGRLVMKTNKKRHIYQQSAESFGTPQYLLDERILKIRSKQFKKVFQSFIPNSEFYYAFKSNDLPYLINKIKKLGYNADVAGKFELMLALKLGFKKILFTGPGKNEEELILALKNHNKVIINIDNSDELDTLTRIIKEKQFKPNVRVSLRICTSEELAREWSKFGIPPIELISIIKKIIENPGITLCGLHFHSSWNKTPERYQENIRLLGKMIKKIPEKYLNTIKFLDIGGGFEPGMEGELLKSTIKGRAIEILNELDKKNDKNTNSSDFIVEDPKEISEFAKEISKELNKSIYPKLNRKIKIYIEPGRYISKHATLILTKVICNKGNSVIADAGQNIIGDDSLASWEYAPIINLTRPSQKRNKIIVYGSTCDPHDILGYSYYGKEIRKGDMLAVLNQGAYTFSFARRFIKPIAQYIVLKENGKLSTAKKVETFQDRYRGCKL